MIGFLCGRETLEVTNIRSSSGQSTPLLKEIVMGRVDWVQTTPARRGFCSAEIYPGNKDPRPISRILLLTSWASMERKQHLLPWLYHHIRKCNPASPKPSSPPAFCLRWREGPLSGNHNLSTCLESREVPADSLGRGNHGRLSYMARLSLLLDH